VTTCSRGGGTTHALRLNASNGSSEPLSERKETFERLALTGADRSANKIDFCNCIFIT